MWWAAGFGIDVSGGLATMVCEVEEWELLFELEVHINFSLAV